MINSTPADFLAPPKFKGPSNEDFDKTVQAISEQIVFDMTLSADLKEQRARTGLGKLLRRSWPVSQLDAKSDGSPAVALEFLPYVGSFDDFTRALSATNTDQPQQRHIVTVVQASGSGKTRLAYAEGMRASFVILVRVWKQKQEFAPAWLSLVKLAEHWASVLPILGADDSRRVSEAATSAMRLLAACYVDFVAAVLSHAAKSAVAHGKAVSFDFQREVVLRCLRNGRGDDAVAALFHARLALLVKYEDALRASSAPGSQLAIIDIADCNAIGEICRDARDRLRGLLQSTDADVVMFFDEAHSLMRTPKIFQSFPKAAYEAVAAAQPQDLYFGLTALCAHLTDTYKLLQVLCGTWLDMTTRAALPDVSPLRRRTSHVYHASRLTTDAMVSILRHFFNIDDGIVTDLLPRLAELRGRPIFFFDDMLTSLWNGLSGVKTSKAAPAKRLRQVLLDAADSGIHKARERMLTVVQHSWCISPKQVAMSRTTEALYVELYAAIRMNGGSVTLLRDASCAALQVGLLALPVEGAQGPFFLALLLSMMSHQRCTPYNRLAMTKS